MNGVAVKHFLAGVIGCDGHPHRLVERGKLGFQRRVILRHGRLLVNALFLEIQFSLEVLHRRVHCCQELILINLISLIFRNNLIALTGLVLRDIGVRRLCHKIPVREPQAVDLPGQLTLVKFNHRADGEGLRIVLPL